MNAAHRPVPAPSATVSWHRGLAPYEPVWRAMRDFNDARASDAPDAIWLMSHQPVFTLGTNSRPEHLLMPGDIPVVQTDRGGQVTYHGPGQLMLYPLVDIQRLGLGVRSLVTALEQAMVDCLAQYGIASAARADAPGVYVQDAKIGSIGLRIRRGCSYHGLALNVDMDLSPFERINPCGYSGLRMTDVVREGGPADMEAVADTLLAALTRHLGLPGTPREDWRRLANAF
ncbi:MAG: octanoyltransferase [Salinisphaeraceae bacterium]|nr:octanoyltransferase [Salinisphaeraceae bacterium]